MVRMAMPESAFLAISHRWSRPCASEWAGKRGQTHAMRRQSRTPAGKQNRSTSLPPTHTLSRRPLELTLPPSSTRTPALLPSVRAQSATKGSPEDLISRFAKALSKI